MKKYTDKSKSWETIIGTIWEISKCDKIVKEGRRRMLYKNITVDNITKYNNLYNDIWEKYVLLIKQRNIKCHLQVKLENGVHGELDMLMDKQIIDFKTSCENGVKAEWILQVLCYAYMCVRETGSISTRYRYSTRCKA